MDKDALIEYEEAHHDDLVEKFLERPVIAEQYFEFYLEEYNDYVADRADHMNDMLKGN